MNKANESSVDKGKIRDSNICIGTGIGIGLLGTAAALSGAVCPICFVAAPGLIAVGAVARKRAKKGQESKTSPK